MPVHLLIVGETTRAEAAPLVNWIAASLQPAQVRQFLDFAHAVADLSGTDWIPDLAVVIQCWPDQFSAKDLDHLFAVAPLARLTVCYGQWCESDGRNRHAWPLAVRVPIHSAATRLFREWQTVCGDKVADLLPLSASREEVFAADHAGLKRTTGIRVAVDSPDPSYQAYLVEMLRNCGFTAASVAAHYVRCEAVLFDADPDGPQRRSTLQMIRKQYAGCPVIALLSAPSPQSDATLMDLGATAVLWKLGDQQRIVNAIEQSVSRAARQ